MNAFSIFRDQRWTSFSVQEEDYSLFTTTRRKIRGACVSVWYSMWWWCPILDVMLTKSSHRMIFTLSSEQDAQPFDTQCSWCQTWCSQMMMPVFLMVRIDEEQKQKRTTSHQKRDGEKEEEKNQIRTYLFLKPGDSNSSLPSLFLSSSSSVRLYVCRV